MQQVYTEMVKRGGMKMAEKELSNVIEFDDETKSRLQKEYVRNWIKRNLQNVAEIDDDWCE